MKKKYILTCGTSISNGFDDYPVLDKLQKKMFKHPGFYNTPNDTTADSFQKAVADKINQLKEECRDNITQLAHKLGAEISLLHELKLDDTDKVVLLVSDSMQGRICSEFITKNVPLICPNHSNPEVTVQVINGFNLNDKNLIIKKGMEQLVSKTLIEIDEDVTQKGRYDVILAPLGGYKAMVSYLTVIGMLYNKPTVYMFEHINQLFFMPSLPFSFDIEVYAKAEKAIKRILDGEKLQTHEFLKYIDGYSPKNDPYDYDKNLYMSFVEVQPDRTLSVSTLASILFDLDDADHTIKISQKAKKEYDSLTAVESKDKLTTLINLSAKKLLRRRFLRPFNGTDLLRIGFPGTGPRIAGYLIENEFYVTHIFTSHDVYERDLGKSQKSDFPEKVFVDFN